MNEMLKLVRRWLRSRQGRLILVGAVAGASFTGLAFAQEPSATAVAPAPTVTATAPATATATATATVSAAPAPTEPAAAVSTATGPTQGQVPSTEHGQGVPFPAAHPPAEQAAGAAHGAAQGEPAGHGAPGAEGHAAEGSEGHGGHAVHHPEAFNFADIERFRIEKEKAARGDKDEHGNPIVPVTPYVYVLVNAAILFIAYYKFGKKPIGDGLAERHNSIAKELAEASRIKEEAEARAAEYKDKLERLEEELQQIKADIIKAGEADRARIVREAEEKADRMKKDAQFLLDQELKQLRNDMITFTAEAAVAAAEAVLKSKVTPADHDRLADEFLKDVSKTETRAGGAS